MKHSVSVTIPIHMMSICGVMIELICGDALHIPLADKTVQCVITSPPYYGLRDYGIGGQIGLEQSPEKYVAKMVDVFREVRRVLRDDGIVWLNLGDSYWGGKGSNACNDTHIDIRIAEGRTLQRPQTRIEGMKVLPTNGKHPIIKSKDMIGIPWRVAFALQADGWYLRSDIIWHKPNVMPESIRDRPTKSHEYLFLLSKNKKYYYDQDAIREPQDPKSLERMKHSWDGNSNRGYPGGSQNNIKKYMGKSDEEIAQLPGRNKRTVWTINNHGYSGAHFATFPLALVEPCLLAGSSERGCCPTCGKSWERVIEKTGEFVTTQYGKRNKSAPGQLPHSVTRNGVIGTQIKTTFSWKQSCACLPADPIPCTVLDPFAGTFTVGAIAAKHLRNAVGIELNPKYIELARQRNCDIKVMFGSS